MLVCTLEIWPDGCDDRKHRVGEILIRPDGGDRHVGHYLVAVQRSAAFATHHRGPYFSGCVRNFHYQVFGPYDLLLRGLIAAMGGRSHAAVRQVPDGVLLFDPPASPEEVAYPAALCGST